MAQTAALLCPGQVQRVTQAVQQRGVHVQTGQAVLRAIDRQVDIHAADRVRLDGRSRA